MSKEKPSKAHRDKTASKPPSMRRLKRQMARGYRNTREMKRQYIEPSITLTFIKNYEDYKKGDKISVTRSSYKAVVRLTSLARDGIGELKHNRGRTVFHRPGISV